MIIKSDITDYSQKYDKNKIINKLKLLNKTNKTFMLN